jgi:hypothetical protein
MPIASLGAVALFVFGPTGVLCSNAGDAGAATTQLATAHRPLPKGTYQIALLWKVEAHRAVFTGRLGRIVLSGTSTEKGRYVPVFDAVGKLGAQKFKLVLSAAPSGAAITSGLVFHVTGTVGAEPVRGDAHMAANVSTGSGNISFSGSVGPWVVSGSTPIMSSPRSSVDGLITVGS